MTEEAGADAPISVRVPEACRITGLSRSKLYALIRNGEIAIVKVGAATLIPTQVLRDFIASRTTSR